MWGTLYVHLNCNLVSPSYNTLQDCRGTQSAIGKYGDIHYSHHFLVRSGLYFEISDVTGFHVGAILQIK